MNLTEGGFLPFHLVYHLLLNMGLHMGVSYHAVTLCNKKLAVESNNSDFKSFKILLIIIVVVVVVVVVIIILLMTSILIVFFFLTELFIGMKNYAILLLSASLGEICCTKLEYFKNVPKFNREQFNVRIVLDSKRRPQGVDFNPIATSCLSHEGTHSLQLP